MKTLDTFPNISNTENIIPDFNKTKPLFDHDYHLIRLRKRDKRPLQKNWTTVPPLTVAEAKAHMESGGNLGIRPRPTDLIVDVDPRNGGMESLKKLDQLIGTNLRDDNPCIDTPSKGFHIYTGKPADVEICKNHPDFPGLDFNPVQVVAPGSIHPKFPSGPLYDWDLATPELPAKPAPQALLDLITKKAKAPTEAGSGEPEWAPEMLKKALDQLDVTQFRVYDTWLQLMMAAHEATGGLGEDEFVRWSTSDPYYSADGPEIEGRWDTFEAGKTGNAGVGTLIKILIDHGVTDIPNNPAEDFAGMEGESANEEQPKKAGMIFTPLGELLNEPDEETRWLWEGRLPTAGDSLLVAKPKAGKSTLARGLALAVARGEPYLGYETEEGQVFYLALEEKRAEVVRHFKAMGGTEDDPIYIFFGSSPKDGLRQLKEAALKNKPKLIIIDPLFRFVRVTDGNDYAMMTNALEPVHELARETGAHILAVHHEPKAAGSDGIDAPLGSTAISGSVDTMMRMKRNERYRTLSSIQRYGTDLEEMTLEYDPDTRTLSAGVQRAEADQREAAKAIIEFLRTQPEPVEESTIHESVEGRKQVKIKALRQAVRDGKIIRTGTGKKGNVYHYSISSSREQSFQGDDFENADLV